MEIDKLIKIATLEKNGTAKEAYRAIKAELLLNKSSKNPKPEGKELTRFKFRVYDNIKTEVEIKINELDLSIIRKLIKEREEQVSMYDANSRKDLADMYREQLNYLKELLPPEISKEKIQEIVTVIYPNGFTQKEMGKVIKKVKEIYPTADGKLISEVVKNYISNE
jgi:uncharacterized protein YqeY